MKIVVREPDPDRLLRHAGTALCEKVEEKLAEREQVTLAVPGGRSVVKIFVAMRDAVLDWRRVQFFLLDERLVPTDHADSNFRLLREHLIAPLCESSRISPANAHPFLFDPESADRGVGRYEDTLAEHGFRFDVVLLSAGEDGHVGALFPNHHSVADPRHGFIVMDDSPKPPPGRMTSSRSLVQTASSAVLLFVGEGKRDAYRKFNDGRVKVAQCPAKMSLGINSLTVLTDLEAKS